MKVVQCREDKMKVSNGSVLKCESAAWYIGSDYAAKSFNRIA